MHRIELARNMLYEMMESDCEVDALIKQSQLLDELIVEEMRRRLSEQKEADVCEQILYKCEERVRECKDHL